MKKFLSSLVKTKTRIALLAASFMLLTAFATPFGDINMNRVAGRLPRLGVGVDIVTNVGYTLNGLGHILYRTSGYTDSTTIKLDTTGITLANVVEATGVVDGKVQIGGTGTSAGVTITGRIHTPQGTNVASAANLAVGSLGSTFEITGTTGINLIDTTGFVNGDQITLVFNGSLTVADSTARSGVYAPINLAGGSNLSATKNDVLTLMARREPGAAAKEWFEVSRTVNAD